MAETVGTGIRKIDDLRLTETEEEPHRPLHPGDIIVARTTANPLSRFIAKFDGWWTHTAISLGDDKVAHAHAGGITTDSLEQLSLNYPDGLAVARPDLPQHTRNEAARWAEHVATELTTEYDAADLGVAFSLLRRASRQPGIDQLIGLDPEDDQEGMGRRPRTNPDFTSTCSGFAYQSYLLGANTRLMVTPAPGIRVVDNQFVVPDREALLDELRGTSQLESMGLEITLDRWRTLLGISVSGVGSAIAALTKPGPVAVKDGVTPMDLWTSPTHGMRWFIRGHRSAIDAATAGVRRT